MKYITEEKLEQINNAVKHVGSVIGDKWQTTYQPGCIEGNVTYGCGNNMKKRVFTVVPPSAFQKTQEELWLKALTEYFTTVDPDTVNNLICENARLKKCEAEALRQAEHWKANHECEVSRARVLKERPDMPLERIRAYNHMVELEEENKRLKQENEDLQNMKTLISRIDVLNSIIMEIRHPIHETARYMQSHFQRPW